MVCPYCFAGDHYHFVGKGLMPCAPPHEIWQCPEMPTYLVHQGQVNPYQITRESGGRYKIRNVISCTVHEYSPITFRCNKPGCRFHNTPVGPNGLRFQPDGDDDVRQVNRTSTPRGARVVVTNPFGSPAPFLIDEHGQFRHHTGSVYVTVPVTPPPQGYFAGYSTRHVEPRRSGAFLY